MSDAPWMRYSRWQARKVDGRWVVRAGLDNRDAPEPNDFDDYGPALKRADALNAEEVAAMLVMP